MKLLALIFAFATSHFIPKPQRFRNFSWFDSWAKWLQANTAIKNKESVVILIVGLPVLLISALLFSLINSITGSLIISVIVLIYVIGPESLDEDIKNGTLLKKLKLRKNAKPSSIIMSMTKASRDRWFGVFFWYVVLGIPGALIYRLGERLHDNSTNDEEMVHAREKLMKVLNYPVAWIMVISLAIASDFERILKKCRPFMNWESIKNMDDCFLYEAADFAVENCEIEPELEKTVEQVTIEVLKRMLVVWLVVVSIQVILAI